MGASARGNLRMLPFFDYCRQAYEQVFRIPAPAEDPWEIGHGGSRRSFFRLGQPPRSLVGMLSDTPPADSRGITENDSFLYVALSLSQAGAPVPRVFAADRARGWFVMEDVGEILLYHEVQRLGRGLAIKALYRLAVDDLVWMHVKASPGFDSSRTHNPDYRRDFVRRHESGYFQQAFLQNILQWDPVPLSLDLDRLADAVDALWTPHFLYRDFQSQNIAVQGSRLRYLDFQGGRRGPRQYDLASLVYDPYAVLDSELQAYLVDRYVERARALEPGFDGKRFRADFPIVAVHRLMQALGAYGYLTRTAGKSYFYQFIPGGVHLLGRLLGQYPELETFPALAETIRRLVREVGWKL